MNNYIIRPQEIYLLERYSSPAYFKEIRDAFANMLEAAEYALELFINDLPFLITACVLSINRQHDIVWGERVLLNLRDTLDNLNVGYRKLLKGDLAAIGYGGNVKSDFRAISMDYDIYSLNQQYSVEVDEVVPVAGIYVPNRADASAQVLLDGMLANEANVGYDPDTTHAVGRAPVTWMLVERIAVVAVV